MLIFHLGGYVAADTKRWNRGYKELMGPALGINQTAATADLFAGSSRA